MHTFLCVLTILPSRCFHLLHIFIISKLSKLEFNQIQSDSIAWVHCASGNVFFSSSFYETNPRFSFLQLLSDPCLTTSWTPTMPKSSLPTATKTNFPMSTKNAKFNLPPRPISPVISAFISTPVLCHFHPA